MTAARCTLAIGLLVLSLASMLPIAGCGRSDRPATVPVEGKITWSGGPWPRPGTVYFVPVRAADGFPQRPGVARLQTDGSFQAQTFEDGDGLLPGVYKIALHCWKVPPSMEDATGVSYVPSRFHNPLTSGLELVVQSTDRRLVVHYDVPRK